MGVWATAYLNEVFPTCIYRGILEWSIYILTSESDDFGNTVSIYVYASSPAAVKQQRVSSRQVAKWQVFWVLQNQVGFWYSFLNLFLSACLSLKSTKWRSWCSANWYFMCTHSLQIAACQDVKAVTVCKKDYGITMWPKKAQGCEREKNRVLETCCNYSLLPSFLSSDYLAPK